MENNWCKQHHSQEIHKHLLDRYCCELFSTVLYLSVWLCGEMRPAGDNRLCASHLFSPIHIFPHTATASSEPNSLPPLLKLEYININCLHINRCWCPHSNLLDYSLIYKDTDNVCFFSESMYHLRLITPVHCGCVFPCRHRSNLCITKQE